MYFLKIVVPFLIGCIDCGMTLVLAVMTVQVIS